jgi:hypothetical protein
MKRKCKNQVSKSLYIGLYNYVGVFYDIVLKYWVWSQDRTRVRQELYHLSHSTSPALEESTEC